MIKNKEFLLEIGISNLTKKEILEEIKKWLRKKSGFYQIVTINPEILVLAQKNKKFKKVLNNGQISVPDGMGIILAGKILRVPFKERVTGVELMKEMIKTAHDLGLTVGLIGGRGQVAVKTGECLKKIYPDLKIFALEGFKNIKNQTSEEWARIISIIAVRKPQMLFVAFGAPWQEFFISSLRPVAGGRWPAMVAMGVGGAFDEISGRVRQAPRWIERLGFKWLFRLICQPWRWRRQGALIEFGWLVFKEWWRRRGVKMLTREKLW